MHSSWYNINTRQNNKYSHRYEWNKSMQNFKHMPYFREFSIGSTNHPQIYRFLYSHHLSGWYCVDIVRRKGYLQIDKMKASFKNGRKKVQQVLLPCIEFPGFKKITLESEITSESLKREAVEQLTVTIYKLWKKMAVANKGTDRCP